MRQNELLSADSDDSSLELNSINEQIKEFIETEYGEAVFRHFEHNRPALVRIHTGEEVTWNEAFGDSLEKITKSQKHSLVGLIEGGGQYKLK
jgi:hypothetical protein